MISEILSWFEVDFGIIIQLGHFKNLGFVFIIGSSLASPIYKTLFEVVGEIKLIRKTSDMTD